jgi:hypothetical protein
LTFLYKNFGRFSGFVQNYFRGFLEIDRHFQPPMVRVRCPRPRA